MNKYGCVLVAASANIIANPVVAGEINQFTFESSRKNIENNYIKLASIAPLVEVAGDVLVTLRSVFVEDECTSKGYYTGITCPSAEDETLCSVEHCKEPPSVGYNYLKCTCYCNGENTCMEMGYNKQSCAGGWILDSVCPMSSDYVMCKENPCGGYDNTSPCSPASGYTQTTCLSGDTIKYKCVANPCTGYSASCSAGYVKDTSQTCQSGTTTLYKCVVNTCTGYSTSCSAGYVKDTSQTCQSGSTTLYKCIADSCTGYTLTSPCSPADGYIQTTCLSGTTTKYKCVPKDCTGYYTSCNSGYVKDTSQTCKSGSTTYYKCIADPCGGYVTSCNTGYVKDTSQTCLSGTTTKYKCIADSCSGYDQTSACSPADGFTQTTCLSGTTTKYKCVPNVCTGYVTSCNTGYVKDITQTCQAGTVTKYKCKADPCIGYDQTSPCSPASGYTQTTCLSGTTTKYKCIANPCSGYDYTSCPAGWEMVDDCLSGTTWKFKCNKIVDTAQQCKDAGYLYTSASAPYILTDVCPWNSSYYKTKICNPDTVNACKAAGYTLVAGKCDALLKNYIPCPCDSDWEKCTTSLCVDDPINGIVCPK